KRGTDHDRRAGAPSAPLNPRHSPRPAKCGRRCGSKLPRHLNLVTVVEGSMTLAADRRRFMAWLAGLQLSSALCRDRLWAGMAEQDPPRITRDMLAHAVRVAGDPLPDDALDVMLEQVNQNLRIYAALNARRLDNSVAPPLYFNPVLPGMPVDRTPRPPQRTKPRPFTRPP